MLQQDACTAAPCCSFSAWRGCRPETESKAEQFGVALGLWGAAAPNGELCEAVSPRGSSGCSHRHRGPGDPVARQPWTLPRQRAVPACAGQGREPWPRPLCQHRLPGERWWTWPQVCRGWAAPRGVAGAGWVGSEALLTWSVLQPCPYLCTKSAAAPSCSVSSLIN